jgi:hypothetical protein
MPTNAREAAQAYAKDNLASLAADLLLVRRGGRLGDSHFHKLASMCAAYASEGDPYEYHVAEQLVIQAALELAEEHHPVQFHIETRHDSASVPDTGYASLLPKLLNLTGTVDDMSDDQYGEWVNSLTEEEFFAFIAVSHTKESFLAAVAEAKRRLGAKDGQ